MIARKCKNSIYGNSDHLGQVHHNQMSHISTHRTGDVHTQSQLRSPTCVKILLSPECTCDGNVDNM